MDNDNFTAEKKTDNLVVGSINFPGNNYPVNLKHEITEKDYREIKQNPQENPAFTIEYILGQMELIRQDTAHFHEAIELLRDFKMNTGPTGGHGDAARAVAIQEIVKCRANTIQKQLAIFEKMFDFLTRDK